MVDNADVAIVEVDGSCAQRGDDVLRIGGDATAGLVSTATPLLPVSLGVGVGVQILAGEHDLVQFQIVPDVGEGQLCVEDDGN